MRYDAFISYRHADLDMQIAKKVHGGLENFKLPKSVQKATGRKKIKRVFRDQEELPIGSDLTDNISSALAESEYLIVICSPRTPGSYWVCKEIETFIELHDRQHILAVLIEGEPSDSFPKLLLEDENGNPVEPLAADVRGETKKERNKKFKSELMRLAAALLECNYDDLRQRHRERRMRHIIGVVVTIATVISGLGVGFAMYNAKMAAEIEDNYNLAMDNYNLAMDNLHKAQVNEARYFAETALSLYKDGEREQAVTLALEALADPADETDDRPYVPQAEMVLSHALYTYDIGYDVGVDMKLHHDIPISDIKFDPTCDYIVVKDQSSNVFVWSYGDLTQIGKVPAVLDDKGGVSRLLEYDLIDGVVYEANANGVYAFDLEGNKLWEVKLSMTYAHCNTKRGVMYVSSSEGVKAVDLKTQKVTALIEQDEENRYFFLDNMVFNDEGNMLAVGASLSEKDIYSVFIVNLDTGDYVVSPIMGAGMSDITFTPEQEVVVITYDYSFTSSDISEDYHSFISLLNGESGKTIWSTSFISSGREWLTGSFNLKARTYEDETGEVISQVICSFGNDLYVFNKVTGEQENHFEFTNYINAIRVASMSDTIYVGEEDGTMEWVNGVTGEIYNNLTYRTDVNILDFICKGGMYAIRSYMCPDVLILKVHYGANMEELPDASNYIYRIQASDDGECFAVETGGMDKGVEFYKADGTKLGVINAAKLGFSIPYYMGFLPDGRYLVIDDYLQAKLVDPITMKMDAIRAEDYDSNISAEMALSHNGKYAIQYDYRDMLMYNLEEGKVQDEWKLEELVKAAVPSEDGSLIYLFSEDSGLCTLDVATGEVKALNLSESTVTTDVYNDNLLCLSDDGKYLAVCSNDGLMRVYNTKDWKVVYSDEVSARSRAYMQFMDDNVRFIYQGDDYYIHIVDLATGDKVYESAGQTNLLDDVIEDHERGVIVFCNGSGISAYDEATYIQTAYVDNGGIYLAKDDKVLVFANSHLYKFPFQTIDSLREDALKQFPNATLTDEMKLKYNL